MPAALFRPHPKPSPNFGVSCGTHGTLPARTSVLSKMLLPWAVLDMDTLLDTSSSPSKGDILLGMTSFSSSSLGSVGTQLPSPVFSGMWLSRGTWIEGRKRDQHSAWFGEGPRAGDRDIQPGEESASASRWPNHVVLEISNNLSTIMLSTFLVNLSQKGNE